MKIPSLELTDFKWELPACLVFLSWEIYPTITLAIKLTKVIEASSMNQVILYIGHTENSELSKRIMCSLHFLYINMLICTKAYVLMSTHYSFPTLAQIGPNPIPTEISDFDMSKTLLTLL